LLVGMVAGADERAGLDVTETHFECFGFEFGELARSVETGHGQVVARRPQILADGENVAAGGSEIAEDREKLVGFFAEADHDARLGDAGGIQFFGVEEKLESPLVTRAGADNAIKARHGFGVVIQDFRARIDDGADGLAIALEVGDEDFDAAARGLAADFLNNECKGPGAAEVVVVAIDAGDHCVEQPQFSHGLGNPARLVEIDRFGAALGHGAKAATARAQIAEHHEGGRLVVPALANVGAMGAFAHGVQGERAGQALEVVVVLADGSTGLEPLRFGSGNAAQRLDLHEFHDVFIVAGREKRAREGNLEGTPKPFRAIWHLS